MEVQAKRLQLCKKISMDINPLVLEEGMTEPLTLRFEFSDDTHTVTSISVMSNIDRKMHVVATVNKTCPARAFVYTDRLHPPTVTGHLAVDGNEQSFLQLTWTNPGPAQAGQYSCLVTTTDAQGSSIASIACVIVTIRDPTMEEPAPIVRSNDLGEQEQYVMRMVPKIIFEPEQALKGLQQLETLAGRWLKGDPTFPIVHFHYGTMYDPIGVDMDDEVCYDPRMVPIKYYKINFVPNTSNMTRRVTNP